MTVPPDFTFLAEKTELAEYAASCIAHLAHASGAVVQAGGCAGLWPVALSPYFDRVYTFEPEPTNFSCLQRNIAARPNITAARVALGDREQSVSLSRPKAQAGLWQVSGEGDIPMVRLDDVIEGPIDALVLDVEGYEVQALRGAERVITTHQPLLWFEFLQHTAEIEAFLAAHGYGRPIQGLGGDCYSVHH